MIALVAPFAATVGLAALAVVAGRRSHPRHLVWFLTAGSVVVALSTTAVLSLLAWPLVARVSLVALVGGWRTESVARGVGIPGPVSAMALVALVVIAGLLGRALARTMVLAGRLVTAQRTLNASRAGSIVVVDDQVPMAYAAPAITAAGGRTVVSAGLVDALDLDERAAAIAHEQAHLCHYHHLYGAVLDIVVALNPALSPCARRARFELERWADEDAAAATDRATVARALAKTALARLQFERDAAGVQPSYLGLARYRVSERVQSILESHGSTERPVRSALFLVPALIGVAATVLAMHNMELAFEAIRRLH